MPNTLSTQSHPLWGIVPYLMFAMVLSSIFIGYTNFVPTTLVSTRVNPETHLEQRLPNARIPWNMYVTEAHPSIAVLEVYSGNGPNEKAGVAAGFILSEGLVTCWHNIKDAKKIEAVFPGDLRRDISALWSVDESSDLALLYVDLPISVPTLSLSRQTPPLQSNVVGIGHGNGFTFSALDGRVTGIFHTSELPNDMRAFLLEQLGPRADPLWIQHSVPIVTGFSGGPLLDEDGRVTGVNAWVDEHTKQGYSIAAEHIEQLINVAMHDPFTLDEYRRKRSQRAAINEFAKPSERLASILSEIAAQNYLGDGRRMYRDLQLFAALLNRDRTAGNQTIEKMNEEFKSTLTAASRLFYAKTEDFPSELNMYAEASLLRADEGFVWVGVAEKVFKRAGESETAVLTDIKFTNRASCLIHLEDGVEPPELGKTYVFFGVMTPQIVSFGENPLELRTAHTVECSFWRPLDESLQTSEPLTAPTTSESSPSNP